MKLVSSLAFGSLLGSMTVNAERLTWEERYDLLNACLESAAKCVDESGEYVSGWNTKQTCTSKGHTWVPKFDSADSMKAAFDAARSRVVADKTRAIFIAQLEPKVTISKLKDNLPAGVEFADLVRCKGGEKFALLDGYPVDVEQEGFLYVDPLVFPSALKVSPNLAKHEAANPATESDRIVRRIRLSPSGKARVESVYKSWKAKHEARRLLQADEKWGDLEFHYRHPFLEKVHGRGLEATSDFKSTPKDIIASTSGDGSALDWLSAEPEAYWVEPFYTYETFNMDAVYVTQAGLSLKASDGFGAQDRLAPFWQIGVHGEGEVVAVGDSGLDTNHCFFSDTNSPLQPRESGKIYNYESHRKVIQYAAHVDGDEGKTRGHGTHVAGSVLGKAGATATSNVGSANAMKGMAYEAKIALFDLGTPSQGGGIFPPGDLADEMFLVSYQVGARIHTNSWGGRVNEYSGNSRAVDVFTWEKQDMVVLFANGNSGQSPTGTMGSPATAKNCISVGASMNTDRAYAFVENTCPSGASPNDCANNMAPFSSSGPTFDGRIKPDVSAPGMYIGSSNSQTQCDMMWIAGTSMATPVVAGNAALVRQFIREGRFVTGQRNDAIGFQPMGALVKAVIVNGATLMSGSYSGQNAELDASKPTPAQGHGRVNLGNTLLTAGNSPKKSTFLDGDMAKMPQISQTGAQVQYKLKVSGSESELRVTLAWYDYPAAELSSQSLINDLDIEVVDPTGKKFYPNGLTQADTVNNVENIIIPAGQLTPGEYIITVKGSDITQGPQPFAVAATGQFELGTSGGPGGQVVDETGNSRPIFDDVSGDGPSTTVIIIAVVGALVVVGAFVAYRRRSSSPGGAGGGGMRGPAGGAGGPGGFQPMQSAMSGFRGMSQRFNQSFGGGSRGGPETGRSITPSMGMGGGGGGMPPGWASAIDPGSGATYYYNRSTGQTSWDLPK